jgi:hypothetical protein
MQTLEEKIRHLPPELAKEVENFVEFLLAKRQLLCSCAPRFPGLSDRAVDKSPD